MIAAAGLPVQVACRVLGVAESGFYEQRNRPPSERAVRHAWLTDLITQVHVASHGRYGARRVHAELTLARGVVVGHQQVELLMRRAGLQGLTGRRKWKRIIPDQIAIDLVERDFTRAQPNQLWVTDITEHRTREGKVYCCVVLDTFSRRVVGCSIDSTPTAALATNALGMAIETRLGGQPAAGTVIHSDQGVQFGSWAFTTRAKQAGLLPSMGSIGDLVRQRHDRGVLVPDAGRTARYPELGYPGSNWRTPCSPTSRSGTTGDAATANSAGSHP